MRVLPDMGTFVPASPSEILRPAKFWFVLLSIAAGLALNVVPLPPEAMTYRPDFLALVLLYWCIQEPRFVGVGMAWLVGLVMDVGDATVFGQHALAYAVLAYGAEYFRRRVLRFPLWQQAVQVAVLLVLCSLIVLLVRFVGGAILPHWTYLIPPLVGAFLWPLVSVLLQSPQRPSRSRNKSEF
jgi:rod shape-determining protein MreD